MPDFTDVLQAALAPSYTLERELTGGGMSRVFVATDVALARQVVVKVLPPELAAGVNRERFRREIQVAAQLQHPHVVPLLTAGEQGELIWYTMPFIQGESLKEVLARGKPFTVRDTVRILHDVADALAYAHGLGVIHRDIKPGNVLLLRQHALVTDFGVAKAISASMPSSGFTTAGMAIGTPAYMAPEQIAADPAADHRVDLYALGLLAYEMLAGHQPFKEDSPQKTMAAQLTRDPPSVDSLRADVPAALSALVRRLLAKQPQDRPQLASEVVAVLDDLAVHTGGALSPLRATGHPTLARAVVIAAAAVAIVGVAWQLGERSGTESGALLARDSLLAAESTHVLASPAALLTREDSMAIARAVTARMQRERPAAGGVAADGAPSRAEAARTDTSALRVLADSFRAQIQRAVLDSLVHLRAVAQAVAGTLAESARAGEARALALSTQTPVNGLRPGSRGFPELRVIVAEPRASRNRPEMDAIVKALADSLRRALDAHPRYVVVPPDSVSAALVASRTVDALQERLKANLLVSISLIPGADSVTRNITVRELSGGSGDPASVRVVSDHVAAASPGAGLGDLVRQVVRALFELERAARARTAGAAVPPPEPSRPDGGPLSGPRPPRP
ncbi:MAG: serine/threonine protein kinase [Gemmatimonadota bacterium]|nr:serine/threonine protein kinase [Gemmatimonadota bacterium]